MAALELVQRKFAASREADTALNWSTILYRLYLRPKGDPPFQFSGRKIWDADLDFDPGVGMTFDERGRLLVAHRNGWSLFGQKVERSEKADRTRLLPSAAAIASNGTIVVVHDEFVIVDQAKPFEVPLRIPQPDNSTRPAKVLDLESTWNDTWLMADERTKTIRKASKGFLELTLFIDMPATRLAVNDIDDLAAIDGDQKTVTLFDRDKTKIKDIPRQGAGWRFNEPADIAFDGLANLYVLDKSSRIVAIFDPSFRFIRAFELPRTGDGAIKNISVMTIDPAGRLFLLGDDAAGKRRVMVYQ